MINGENVDTNMNIRIEENNINIYNVLKRTVDIFAAIIGIVLLCPIMLVVFIANKLQKDNGPIFFMQKRIGLDGKMFRLYKFRTMVVDADKILMKKLRNNAHIASPIF